jgi:hypothetical protein
MDSPNGHVTVARIVELLAECHRAAASLQASLAGLTGGGGATPIELEAPAAGESSTLVKKRKQPKKTSRPGTKTASRQASALLLAKIARNKTPVPTLPQGASILVQHGYLKKEAGGYVRTDKVFTP